MNGRIRLILESFECSARIEKCCISTTHKYQNYFPQLRVKNEWVRNELELLDRGLERWFQRGQTMSLLLSTIYLMEMG